MTIGTSVAITKSNIFTQVFTNIFNLINDNISNPNDSTGNTKFVYSHREPNFMSRNFAGFPCIVVEAASISQDVNVISATKAFMSDEINIIIFSQDKSSDGSGNPSGADTMNTISDEVLKTLNANRTTLRTNGLKNLTIGNTDFDWGEINGQPTFKREITLTFKQLQEVA